MEYGDTNLKKTDFFIQRYLQSWTNTKLQLKIVNKLWLRSVIINIDKGKNSQLTEVQAGARESWAATD